ncbi:HPP family protein [Methylobacterium trifolii]|uniref:Inosine-5'-monophosphate dehydrogenase n=1 Tax=Methylobacterium trifolii TaxID=1003092 RepID=A0ABQ4U4D5_9HYPH|nr:HPP family protein [Methylobacterium trifolii]GJE61759.1 Inosine-5'-monophosphate dehydrogenase [Methylobacterium trifolii]
MRLHLRRLVPEPTPLSLRERVRSAAGALIGILATGLISRAALGAEAALPAMIAPMGASAVLLFVVPASPLAQPWSILGGNLVAALVGVSVAAAVPDPLWAAALAIGCAIALMMALRCLHPPSGAVALTAVLGGPAIRDLGYGFVLWPVAANSLLLLVVALLFNNLSGRTYPHRQAIANAHGTGDPVPSTRAGPTASDLDAALKDFDQVLDVGRGDLEAILRQAQVHAFRRRSGQATCAEIMSRDVVAVGPHTPLRQALELLRRHHVKVLPVTDEGARVLGIVTQTDLLDKAAWDRRGPRLGLGRRLRLTLSRGHAPHGSVEDIMTTALQTVRPDTPIADVVVRMSDYGLHHLPVVGADERLVGIVSQSDLIGALLADAAERAAAPSGRADADGTTLAVATPA